MEIRKSIFEFTPAFIDENGTRRFAPVRHTELFAVHLQNTEPLEFLKIPKGSFLMGAPETEIGSRRNERPVREVSIEPFFIGRIPVTQGQWRAVTYRHVRGGAIGEDLPAVNVWLDEAVGFCNLLSGMTGLSIRLPSEAEWEYACRAGTRTAFSYGDKISPEVANYAEPDASDQDGNRLMTAGSFDASNGFGLLDMHGNVWEWCSDIWHEDYEGAPADGAAWVTGGDAGYCVQRGGSWRSPMASCRSAARVGDIARNDEDIVGIRVCFTP